MKYGIYDIQDLCWIGDSKGPRTFDDKKLAQAACQVIAMQAGLPPTRLRPRALHNTRGMKKKDTLPLRMSSEKALQRVLDGHFH